MHSITPFTNKSCKNNNCDADWREASGRVRALLLARGRALTKNYTRHRTRTALGTHHTVTGVSIGHAHDEAR